MHTRHRRRAVNRTVISFSLLLAAGCGATGSDGSRKAGALAGLDVPIGAVTEDVFVVGGAVAPGWASFSRVRAAAFAGTGDLALLDSDQRRLVVVGPDGNLRREVAGPGENPGDLRRPLSLAALGNDRLVVYDSGHESFLEFGLDGEFLNQVGIETGDGQPARSIGNVLGALPAPDGRLLATATSDDGSGRSIDVFRSNGAREIFYDAWEMPHEAPYTRSDDAQAGGDSRGAALITLVAPPRFAPKLLASVASDGRVAVVDSIGYRVKLVSGAGVVESALERPIRPFDVTAQLEARIRDAEASGPVTIRGSGMTPEVRMAVERQIRTHARRMTFASQIPVIAAIAVDSEDRIWISRNAANGFSRGPTDVFTADGSYLGTLATGDMPMPYAFGPGGLAAYVEKDDQGATVVRVIRLVALRTGSD